MLPTTQTLRGLHLLARHSPALRRFKQLFQSLAAELRVMLYEQTLAGLLDDLQQRAEGVYDEHDPKSNLDLIKYTMANLKFVAPSPDEVISIWEDKYEKRITNLSFKFTSVADFRRYHLDFAQTYRESHANIRYTRPSAQENETNLHPTCFWCPGSRNKAAMRGCEYCELHAYFMCHDRRMMPTGHLGFLAHVVEHFGEKSTRWSRGVTLRHVWLRSAGEGESIAIDGVLGIMDWAKFGKTMFCGAWVDVDVKRTRQRSNGRMSKQQRATICGDPSPDMRLKTLVRALVLKRMLVRMLKPSKRVSRMSARPYSVFDRLSARMSGR
ncbi:hypothetical protein LTR56_017094 [Elasticomyces elasticus]|nr:hypothetical protein LTR56_017094 [Elasticomyces elasticus]KAK3643664.1 hypothetical protein LTR22_015582 [Elasticomyces elasticus]KAK4915164.1 hypothetical protein LTR49_016673 [Elasticomyces elasticus]KAK5749320.1 hypothetical protein LTS12_020638 [Elasticomyces elasticus]